MTAASKGPSPLDRPWPNHGMPPPSGSVTALASTASWSTARRLGITTPLHRYPTTVLGASEMTCSSWQTLSDDGVGRAHTAVRHPAGGAAVQETSSPTTLDRRLSSISIRRMMLIEEGLRGVVRMPGGTAHALDAKSFSIPVMGKTGTTNDFRDAIFVGSTHGVRRHHRCRTRWLRRQPIARPGGNRGAPGATGLQGYHVEASTASSSSGPCPRFQSRSKRVSRRTLKVYGRPRSSFRRHSRPRGELSNDARPLGGRCSQ